MYNHQYPRAYETISRNIYVDDILNSAEDNMMAAKPDKRRRFCCVQKGSFKIKEWIVTGNNENQDIKFKSCTLHNQCTNQKVLAH